MSNFENIKLSKPFIDFLINTSFVCTIDFNCFYIKDDCLIFGVFRRGEKVVGSENIKYKIPSYYIIKINIDQFKAFIKNVVDGLYNKIITYETVDHIRANCFIVDNTFYHRQVESYKLTRFDFLGNIKIEYSKSYNNSKVFNIDNLEAYYVILQTYINDMISFKPLTSFGFRVVKYSTNNINCYTYQNLQFYINELIKCAKKELYFIGLEYGLKNSINFYNYFKVLDIEEIESIEEKLKNLNIEDQDKIEIIESIKK